MPELEATASSAPSEASPPSRFVAPDVDPRKANVLLGAQSQKSEGSAWGDGAGTAEPKLSKPSAPQRTATKRDASSEMAATKEDLFNGFPFAGVVQRYEADQLGGGEWAFLDHVPQSAPLRLAELKRRPDVEPGRYRLITAEADASGQRREIEFAIAGARSRTGAAPAAAAANDDPAIERRRAERVLEHELRRDDERYMQRINERLREENQDLGRQLLQAQSRLARHDADKQQAMSRQREDLDRESRRAIKQAEDEAKRLREKAHEQEMKILRLELMQEMQPRTGETGWDVLKRIVDKNGESILNMLPQILAQAGSGNSKNLQKQLAQMQQMQANSQASSMGDGHAAAAPTVAPTAPAATEQNGSAEPGASLSADVRERFLDGVAERAAAQLAKELTPEGHQAFAQDVLAFQQRCIQEGLQPGPELFTTLTKRLARTAIERAADPQRVAYLLAPFLPQLPRIALAGLKHMPSEGALNLLSDQFNVAFEDDVFAYLTGVLDALKAET